MKNKLNKDLISNIEISDDMKNAIYRNCTMGRSNADFRFKYSGLLSALIVFGVFALFSIGASAAIIGFKTRLSNMDETEYENIYTEVQNDVFISTDEGFSRELRDSEIKRILKLERDYYDNGVFPKRNMPHYETIDEMKEGELAYVASENIVFVPEKDMDDEQLLEYIDHDAKKRYVNIQSLLAEGIEPGVNMALESTPIADGSDASKARKAADKMLKDYFKAETDDSWIVLVDRFDDNELQNGDVITLYDIDYYRLGTGYATSYNIRINFSDLSPLLLNESGYEVFNDVKTYEFSEAEGLAKDGEEYVREYLSRNFGLKDPKEVITDVERYSNDDKTTSCIDYTFIFDDTTVYICYRIEDQRIVSYCRL
ncbi:MAG: hypothetical protein J5856_03570 [Lachnospiraceae bacterium]|nr:hypothetical protein [Lachnospiraceae bacterium]